MLKISAHLDNKQKCFVPKKNIRHVSIRDFKKKKNHFLNSNTCFCSRLYGTYLSSLVNMKVSSVIGNLMLCFRTPVLELLFQNSCFRPPVSKHLFQNTCFRTLVSEHLFQNKCFRPHLSEHLSYL